MTDLIQLLRLQWDRALAIALTVLSFVALLGGWIGVADTVLVSEQVPYVISGGFVGLALAVVAGTLWLSADLRDEWRELRRRSEASVDPLGAGDDLAERVAQLEQQLADLSGDADANGRTTSRHAEPLQAGDA